MKKIFAFAPLVLIISLQIILLAGCASALRQGIAPNSLPVTQGAASTNDSPAVAWLEYLRMTNQHMNPTSTRDPLDLLLASGVTLASVLTGYLARHKAHGTSPPQPK